MVYYKNGFMTLIYINIKNKKGEKKLQAKKLKDKLEILLKNKKIYKLPFLSSIPEQIATIIRSSKKDPQNQLTSPQEKHFP